MRIALCNIENMATQPAILQVLETHKDEIKLVITSDPYSKKNGGFLAQAYKNMRFRGYGFTEYLFVKMVFLSLIRPLLKCFGVDVLPSIEQRCNELGINYIKVKDINSADVVELVRNQNIDFLSIYYFDQILHDEIINSATQGVVNFHPAYLPKCRGLFPIMFSYLYNEENYGISAHWVENKEIDAGPVIAQSAIKVNGATCLLEIDRQVSNCFPTLYGQVLELLKCQQVEARVQSQQSSYFSYPTRIHLRELKTTLPLIQWRWVVRNIGKKSTQ
ncbi:formyltransferase family protein [Pseudoalteromonas umbrosa]|uniref:formyltransferase family protein n=1 Tax=Pseudoalteromonas umbrosa TaxID=3048489 RepID=UPI0024C24D5A|nr:formyltransferase family protein [Pseudoalteromonas sp. B95]MDK1287731.1 formyltransferase family protein [Pseudoalteromonas sp. B95]